MSIPIRNIWWLMLYASDLGKSTDQAQLAAEDLPEEIPDLVVEILARSVEQRQRRQLHAKGQVACRFEELTTDSPRNRYVRAALETVACLVSQPALTHRCRGLAHGLRLQGVMGEPPSRQQISNERFGRHDAIDQPMLAAARLAMDLALPTEEAGPHALIDPQRCVHWLRRLYEKAVGGFYRLHLKEAEWVVSTGRPLS